MTTRWKLRCITDGTWEYTTSTIKPTECPVNAGHSIDASLTSITNFYTTNPYKVNFEQTFIESTGNPPVKGDILVGSSNGIDKVNLSGDNKVLVVDSTQDTGIKAEELDANDKFFGGEYQISVTNTEICNSSKSFVKALRLTTTSVKAGDYKVVFTYRYKLKHKNEDIEIRMELDDTTLLDLSNFKTYSNNTTVSNHGMRTLSLASGVHTFDLDFRATKKNKQVSIEYAMIELYRLRPSTSIILPIFTSDAPGSGKGTTDSD